jgi:malate synthase
MAVDHPVPPLVATSSPPAIVRGPLGKGYCAILSSPALRLVAELQRRFGARRQALLDRRAEVQQRLEAGHRLGFLTETRAIRERDWRVAKVPSDLRDRRVEITGPVDRKMIINALNSGASVFMADFEDSTSPTWANLVEGQINLFEAVRGTIEHTDPETGKHYRLEPHPATLVVRPRGWHLDEAHVTVDGAPVSASLFDFALYFFHNTAELLRRGTGPYFYLPKLESHLEARLWNDVFVAAQEWLGIPRGSIRATVLIETITAAFEMDEILYELREHSAGLNCGRWDYIFSFIKRFRSDRRCLLPDRGLVGMDTHFLRSYSRLLIQTCHRRGAHAMGGMAAQIPIKSDPERNAAALAKVRADKRREVGDGHDGTWVAHPGLVAVARAEFDAAMPEQNQIDRPREPLEITAADLLAVPAGPITEAGLRLNLEVGVLYLAAWLRGAGCVPIHHLMEDAATAEISRTQVWQWLRHGAVLDDGRPLDVELFHSVFAEELSRIRDRVGEEQYRAGRYELAARLLENLITAEQLEEFLTLPAYRHVVTALRDPADCNRPSARLDP